jgi:hypothetical protein
MYYELLSSPAFQIAHRVVVIASSCGLMVLAAYHPALLP